MDFRLDDDSDDAWLIEVNPRFFAGLFQTIASGVDYPWLLYRMSLGESIDTVPPPGAGVQTHIPVTATLSLLEDAISEGLDFEQLRLGWQEAWDASKEGDFKNAWQSFSQRVHSAFSPRKDDKSLSEQFAELNKAEMEGLSWDDPLTSLGVLVILSALVKTGKLPEEMNTSTKKGDFKPAD